MSFSVANVERFLRDNEQRAAIAETADKIRMRLNERSYFGIVSGFWTAYVFGRFHQDFVNSLGHLDHVVLWWKAMRHMREMHERLQAFQQNVELHLVTQSLKCKLLGHPQSEAEFRILRGMLRKRVDEEGVLLISLSDDLSIQEEELEQVKSYLIGVGFDIENLNLPPEVQLHCMLVKLPQQEL